MCAIYTINGESMKIFLRFLVTIIILAGIGVGVWALFFRKSDSQQVFDALIDYQNFEEETNLFDKITYINPSKSAPDGASLGDYQFLNEGEFNDITKLILGEDNLSGDDFYGYMGTARTGTAIKYYSIYSSQQFIINNFTKYTQFGGDVSNKSINKVTDAIDSLKNDINKTVDHIAELVDLQNKIVSNMGSNFDANKAVLLDYYKTLCTNVENVIKGQYTLANNLKSFVIENIMNNSMDNDTKTILVDCIVRANEQVINATEYADKVSYIKDSSKIYETAINAINNNYLTSTDAQEFVSAYEYLLENDTNGLNNLFKIKGEKDAVASADATNTELLTKHQISQTSFEYVKTILTYFGFGG